MCQGFAFVNFDKAASASAAAAGMNGLQIDTTRLQVRVKSLSQKNRAEQTGPVGMGSAASAGLFAGAADGAAAMLLQQGILMGQRMAEQKLLLQQQLLQQQQGLGLGLQQLQAPQLLTAGIIIQQNKIIYISYIYI